MAHRDPTRPIRTAGIGTPPEEIHEEIVCYAVVSGRGRHLVKHLRSPTSRSFAQRLVACHDGMVSLGALIAEFDSVDWLTKEDRRRARKELVADIRRIARESLDA